MTNYANRGRHLETVISMTNRQYKNSHLALIEKVPNAWIVRRAGKKIVSAFPERKTGVDYIGVTNGRAIAIEAKSTRERNRFPLSMLEKHQLEFLRIFQDQGGASYIIVEFSKREEFYIMTFDFVASYVEVAAAGGRKSIPYEDIVLHADKIESENGYVLHYLKYIRKS